MRRLKGDSYIDSHFNFKKRRLNKTAKQEEIRWGVGNYILAEDNNWISAFIIKSTEELKN